MVKQYPSNRQYRRTRLREITESSALVTVARSGSSRRNKSAPMCSLCQKPHRKRTRELKLYFKCSRLGHQAKACRSKLRPCFKCQGKHHTALCPDSGKKKESKQVQITAVQEPTQEHDNKPVKIVSLSERREETV